MQVSMNAEDANVRSRHDRPNVVDDPKRQSLRLIDLHQELPSRVELPTHPSVRFFDDPFGPPSLEGLPQALLDSAQETRDTFDRSHLKPPKTSTNNSASQSTPSLPIAVAGRPSSSNARERPSELSTSSEHTSMSSASLRLSSSADSALAALPPPPPPPGQARLANNDEVDACGCHDHPDLPPRAALQPPDRPRILPIVENGQRTSYTHYWVIPPRVRPHHRQSQESPAATIVATATAGAATTPNPCSISMENYVNLCPPALVTRSASMPPRTQPRERRYVKRPSGEPDSDLLGCATNRAFVDDMVELGGPELDLDSSFSGPVVSSVESDSSWEAQQQHYQQQQQQQQHRAGPSAEERRTRILAVREAVHGVTDEEAKMILQTHRWEVPRSVRLLKVEQLFRLGVTPSKSVCKKVLDDAGGDLEVASGRLISQQAAPTSK